MVDAGITRPNAPKAPKRSLPILIAVVVLVLGGWAARTFFVGSQAPTNILLMGVDEGKTRTDVVVLAHIDPKQGLVSVLSVPRDTLVDIPCDGLKTCRSKDKLAHAHVYGGEKGPELTVRAVEGLLDVKIPYYVRVDYAGFEKVVEALGGVDMVIEKNMDYEDPYASPPLKIHFKGSPNPQHLTGTEALKFVRFRADGLGDIGRIDRTRKFFLAMVQTARKNGTAAKLPGLVSTLLPYIDTNLNTATAVALARMAKQVDLSQVAVEMVPGRDDPANAAGWVWVADQAKTKSLVEQLINNPVPKQAEGK